MNQSDTSRAAITGSAGLRGLLLVCAAAALAACGTARRAEPVTGPLLTTDPLVQRGAIAYARHCHECHTGGEAALGPSLNDKPLPGFLIRLQVRRGFGAMPAFDEGHVSERELEEIVAYMRALRAQGRG